MRISLRTLMLCVALVAIITAALAQPSLFWMRMMFTLAIGFLAFSAVGALAARGKPRTFWIGAAVFGGGYFWLLMEGAHDRFNSSSSAMLSRAVMTQPLLDALAAARGLQVRSASGNFRLWDEAIYYNTSSGGGGFGSGIGGPGMPAMGSGMGPAPPGGGGFFDVDPEGLQETDGGSSSPPGSAGPGENSDAGVSGYGGSMGPPPGMSPMPGGSSMGSPGPGMGMMPGSSGAPPLPGAFTAASYNHFLITGHCAFVILVGLVGGLLSRWAFGREQEA